MHYIANIMEKVLDFLLPGEKIDSITSSELSEKISHGKKQEDSGTIVLFDYSDPAVKRLIWSLKYKGNLKTAKLFAEVLSEYLLEELSDLKIFSDFNNPMLISIPLSKKRMRERGFNQVERIAKLVVNYDKNTNYKLETNILKRIKHTPSQTKLVNKEERIKSIRGAFEVASEEQVRGRNIILLDDVITTGSTLNEAKNTLLGAGARKVICVALAH